MISPAEHFERMGIRDALRTMNRDTLNDEALRWIELAGRHAEEIEQLRAERDQLRKANEVMANALQGSAYDTKGVLQLCADLQEARAELDAVKAKRRATG